MVSNFRVGIVIRILVIVSFVAGLLLALLKTNWLIVPFIILFILIGAIAELIIYVEKTNKEFANFLLAIKNSDFSKYNATDKRGRSFSQLKTAQNIIINEFQSIRINNEAHYFFLQRVVEHVNTAIISFDEKGEIFLINDAAKKLLHIPNLKNVYSLQSTNKALCKYLTELLPGNNPVLELNRNNEKLKLSMRVSNFTVQGIEHKLISIQNIKSEAEDIELLAWEQLIRVLTHEIMNSMTPISSLSSVLKNKADKMAISKHDIETFTDLADGLEVIERRSIGLMDFVNNYKKINTLPEPEFKKIKLIDLFTRLKMLKREEFLNKKAELILNIKEDLFLNLDIGLIEQVLINLINNSLDATEGIVKPEIELAAQRVDDKIIISVKDNGNGIHEENLNKVFIPFFTTKKTGSGIGLSFSKQVMRLHKGNVTVNTISEKGTQFCLEFPVN